VPPDDTLSPIAKRRLAAIREFSDLGSGFRIAALDLEIRGAGNLLGGEQSGHIDAVGFETYMKLLEETIRELKGEDIDTDRRATVNLHLDLRIDDAYIPDMNQRLAVYRRVAGGRSSEEIERLLDELRDRYGAPPPSVLTLAAYAGIRVKADGLGIDSLDRQASAVMIKFRHDTTLDPAWLLRQVHGRPDLTLVPPASVRLDLNVSPETPKSGRARSKEKHQKPTSWWTTTATSGESRPVFNKAALTKGDEHGESFVALLFSRINDVLDVLSRGLTAS
jgi:transcription-repair coupling factor (superfamily II helicase)